MKRVALIVAFIGIVALMPYGKAHALGIPGLFGYAPSQPSCFGGFGGSIINSCNTQLAWFIPLSVNSGNHTVAINGSNLSGSLNCDVLAVTQTGGIQQSVVRNFPGGTGTQNVTVTVPANGSIFIDCVLALNDEINSVNYA